MTLLVIGGIGIVGFFAFRHFEMGEEMPISGKFPGCWVALLLPLLAMLMAGWARRRISNPLADVLDAAEKVSQGDFSVRVPENRHSSFRSLERSFNRMVSELERVDQQRRNLTADVAHELRTPLHVIQGYLEGILDGVYPPDEDTVNMMLDETHLLARLVDDLRTLSLAEAGELPLQLQEVSLTEVIADVHTSFSGQAEAAGVSLNTDVEENLTLTADPDRLDQILSNLVVNALRHTPEGGETTITAQGDGNRVYITVEDNGEGISPEDLPFIFDRFWRADKSRQHVDGTGHGLGLAIAQQLVRAHRGEINVVSEVGVGTKFTLEFPVTVLLA
jgi:two-component system OmpR family sensor kinase/two-component system sensor histidine kinase BaeS